jgi:hypothetical protein
MLQTGVISNARDPARDAWLYNPRAASGSRFRTLAASGINRYYHSIALLLPDASIMVAGCEYGETQPAVALGTCAVALNRYRNERRSQHRAPA